MADNNDGLKCSGCNKQLPKAQYSKSQRKKNESERRCLTCVKYGVGKSEPADAFLSQSHENASGRASTATRRMHGPKSSRRKGGHRPSAHLKQRQEERGITAEQLAEAMELGEQKILSDEGRIRYTHKGMVYIATTDNVGITAFRIEPMQCMCKLGKPRPSDEDLTYDEHVYRAYSTGQLGGRAQQAKDKLFMGLLKAQFVGCPNLDPESPEFRQVCLGPPCTVHRGPTDAVAMHLEKVDWSNPNMREVMAIPDVLGMLILAAAGSLLSPIYCSVCHGVKKLKRSENGFDETDTLTWLNYLLDIAEAKRKGLLERTREEKDWCNSIEPVDFRSIYTAGGCTPLSAAAKAGHYRCVLELLRRGASVEQALMDPEGPTQKQNTMCFLMCKAFSPTNQNIRQMTGSALFEEILSILAYVSENESFQSLSKQEEEVVHEIVEKADWSELLSDRGGGRLVGTVWDGVCHRFIVQTECSCGDARCFHSGTRVLSVGIQLNAQGIQVYDDPLGDPLVINFMEKEREKAECLYGSICCEYGASLTNACLLHDT